MNTPVDSSPLPLGLTDDEWNIRLHTVRRLNDCGGNLSRTARALGISRGTMDSRIARFHITADDCPAFKTA